MNPGDTTYDGKLPDHPGVAQRRPGREPRRHLSVSVKPTSPVWTLNEGRGVNPGDTASNKGLTGDVNGAQRRPGREPRRHP